MIKDESTEYSLHVGKPPKEAKELFEALCDVVDVFIKKYGEETNSVINIIGPITMFCCYIYDSYGLDVRTIHGLYKVVKEKTTKDEGDYDN